MLLSEPFYLLIQEAKEKERMTQNLHNSDNAANFTAAFEASHEEEQHAPFRMPISISRRRPRRRSVPIAKIGFFEGSDRRKASQLVREQAYCDEVYGTPASPEDALNDMIDLKRAGLLDEDSEDEFEREPYIIDGLTEDEQVLVRRFGEEEPEELHPMEEQVINPPSQDAINFWRRVYDVDGRDGFDKLRFELKALREAEEQCYTYRIIVPVQQTLEPADREDETEAHRASDEFKRLGVEAEKRRKTQQEKHREYLRKGGKIKCVRNRGQKHRRYNIDRATPRYERWEDQLPFYSVEAWLEDNLQEAFEEEISACECDEEMEAEAAGCTEEDFQQFLYNEKRKMRAIAVEYEAEIAEELRGYREYQNEKRREFIREYRYTSPRINEEMRKALRNYDMELMIYRDLEEDMERDFREYAEDSYLSDTAA